MASAQQSGHASFCPSDPATSPLGAIQGYSDWSGQEKDYLMCLCAHFAGPGGVLRASGMSCVHDWWNWPSAGPPRRTSSVQTLWSKYKELSSAAALWPASAPPPDAPVAVPDAAAAAAVVQSLAATSLDRDSSGCALQRSDSRASSATGMQPSRGPSPIPPPLAVQPQAAAEPPPQQAQAEPPPQHDGPEGVEGAGASTADVEETRRLAPRPSTGFAPGHSRPARKAPPPLSLIGTRVAPKQFKDPDGGTRYYDGVVERQVEGSSDQVWVRYGSGEGSSLVAQSMAGLRPRAAFCPAPASSTSPPAANLTPSAHPQPPTPPTAAANSDPALSAQMQKLGLNVAQSDGAEARARGFNRLPLRIDPAKLRPAVQLPAGLETPVGEWDTRRSVVAWRWDPPAGPPAEAVDELAASLKARLRDGEKAYPLTLPQSRGNHMRAWGGATTPTLGPNVDPTTGASVPPSTISPAHMTRNGVGVGFPATGSMAGGPRADQWAVPEELKAAIRDAVKQAGLRFEQARCPFREPDKWTVEYRTRLWVGQLGWSVANDGPLPKFDSLVLALTHAGTTLKIHIDVMNGIDIDGTCPGDEAVATIVLHYSGTLASTIIEDSPPEDGNKELLGRGTEVDAGDSYCTTSLGGKHARWHYSRHDRPGIMTTTTDGFRLVLILYTSKARVDAAERSVRADAALRLAARFVGDGKPWLGLFDPRLGKGKLELVEKGVVDVWHPLVPLLLKHGISLSAPDAAVALAAAYTELQDLGVTDLSSLQAWCTSSPAGALKRTMRAQDAAAKRKRSKR